MSIASNTVAGILDASFNDVTEAYAELLEDWYGEDLSLIDHDDEDLAAAIWRLTYSTDYWRDGPYRLTPYEKLRARYEALLEMHQSLLEECRTLKSDIRRRQGIRHDRAEAERMGKT